MDMIGEVSNFGIVVKTEPELDINESHDSHQVVPCNYVYTLKRAETDYFLIVSQVILNSSKNLFKVNMADP